MNNYFTEDEIVNDLYENLQFENRVVFSKQDPLMHHHKLGTWIRNRYKLWDKENPYTIIGCEDAENCKANHPLHPDQVSNRIIMKLQEKIRMEKYNE